MISTKVTAASMVAFAALPILQANAASITLGPGTPTSLSSTKWSMGLGDVNVFTGQFPQLAVGDSNQFTDDCFGIMAGWANEMYTGAYGSIQVGQGNENHTPFSAVFGESNKVVQDFNTQWNAGNLVAGLYNELDGFAASLVVGQSNSLILPSGLGVGASGTSSMVVGGLNEVEATGAAWVIGYANSATGNMSSSFGWGLVNPGLATTVIGSYNGEIQASSNVFQEGDAAFVVANGASNTSRSNAIETLKNGETTLINKAWNPAQPLNVPAAPNSANGRALVVEGHTLLKGQVVIEQPQGDISMGIYE